MNIKVFLAVLFMCISLGVLFGCGKQSSYAENPDKTTSSAIAETDASEETTTVTTTIQETITSQPSTTSTTVNQHQDGVDYISTPLKDFEYIEKDDTIELYRYIGNSDVLVIPRFIDNKEVVWCQNTNGGYGLIGKCVFVEFGAKAKEIMSSETGADGKTKYQYREKDMVVFLEGNTKSIGEYIKMDELKDLRESFDDPLAFSPDENSYGIVMYNVEYNSRLIIPQSINGIPVSYYHYNKIDREYSVQLPDSITNMENMGYTKATIECNADSYASKYASENGIHCRLSDGSEIASSSAICAYCGAAFKTTNPYREYCDEHSCAVDGCENRAIYSTYCSDHTCSVRDCENLIVEGKTYCSEHKCQSPFGDGCDNPVWNIDSIYCSEHSYLEQ